MEEPFSDDVDVMMDLNRHIDNLIIVGGVDFNKTGSKRSASKINRGPQLMLEAVCMDWLISNTQCIGIATMHANGGYKGLARVVNWLNLKVPTLLLDVRKRDSYEEKASFDSYKAKEQSPVGPNENGRKVHPPKTKKASPANGAAPSSEGENATSESEERENPRLKLWEKLFAEVKKKDYEFYQKMLEQGKVDLFEVCRLSHLHTLLAPKSKVKQSESLNLHSAIQKAYEETLDNGDDKPDSFVWQDHAELVTEYLLETEFRAYWEMKPNSEKKRACAERHRRRQSSPRAVVGSHWCNKTH